MQRLLEDQELILHFSLYLPMVYGAHGDDHLLVSSARVSWWTWAGDFGSI